MNRTVASRYRGNFWSHLTAISLVLVPLSLTGWEPVLAQEQQSRIITVTGQGAVTVPTTLTQVVLGVEVTGQTAQQVQQEVARRSDAVVALLRSRNVEKLQTAGISLNPTYRDENGRQRLTGFVGTNTVSFRIATEKSGTLLDDAIKAGATRIDGISFVASDASLREARQQALREATDDAQKQADAVLGVLNFSRREIVNIQVNAASPVPQPFASRSYAPAVADIAASTPVIGGEQEVQASVTMQIRY
ncbi:MAG: SIMPL domain-containing protein [Oscillatoria princeps RMCB-10]|nr:SIMPL domain-containing protein [Oscillatoria princeps RMCB-10]